MSGARCDIAVSMNWGSLKGGLGFRADPSKIYMAVSKNQRPLFGSPYQKDHGMLGSILGLFAPGAPRSFVEQGVSISREPRVDPKIF